MAVYSSKKLSGVVIGEGKGILTWPIIPKLHWETLLIECVISNILTPQCFGTVACRAAGAATIK